VLQHEADGLGHSVTGWLGCCQRLGFLQVVLVQVQWKEGGCEGVGTGRISGNGSASEHSDCKCPNVQSLAIGEEVAVIRGNGVGCRGHSGAGIEAIEGDLQCLELLAFQNLSKRGWLTCAGETTAGDDPGLAEFVEGSGDALWTEHFFGCQ